MDLKNYSSAFICTSINGIVVSGFTEAEKVAVEIAGKAMRKRKRQKKNSKGGKKSSP